MPRRRTLRMELELLGLWPRTVRPTEPPLQTLCLECRTAVRVTDRGTFYKHRPVRELAAYCPHWGPRAPRKLPKGPRPDLALQRRDDFAAWLLDLLDQQDAARAWEATAYYPPLPHRALVRSRKEPLSTRGPNGHRLVSADSNTDPRKRRGPPGYRPSALSPNATKPGGHLRRAKRRRVADDA